MYTEISQEYNLIRVFMPIIPAKSSFYETDNTMN